MRTDHTAEDVLSLASELVEVVQTLQQIGGRMTSLEMATLSIHANTATNKHLRALWEWARRVEADAETQFRLFEKQKAAAAARSHVHKTIAKPGKTTTKKGTRQTAPVAHPPVHKAATVHKAAAAATATARKAKTPPKSSVSKRRVKSRR